MIAKHHQRCSAGAVSVRGPWRVGVSMLIAVLVSPTWADPYPPPEGVASLSASVAKEVSRDVLTITLSATRDANDAATVQTQLKQVIDAALLEAKKATQSPGVEVRTGAFGLSPRYGSNARINGWQGSAEIILEGREQQKVAQVAARLQGMNVTQVSASLSREVREQQEAELASSAVQKFRVKAQSLAKDFGYKDYVLREVQVQAHESGGGAVALTSPMAATRSDLSGASSATPVPVNPGKSTVVVTVTGSVQLKY